jgi:hypothetical protein
VHAEICQRVSENVALKIATTVGEDGFRKAAVSPNARAKQQEVGFSIRRSCAHDPGNRFREPIINKRPENRKAFAIEGGISIQHGESRRKTVIDVSDLERPRRNRRTVVDGDVWGLLVRQPISADTPGIVCVVTPLRPQPLIVPCAYGCGTVITQSGECMLVS